MSLTTITFDKINTNNVKVGSEIYHMETNDNGDYNFHKYVVHNINKTDNSYQLKESDSGGESIIVKKISEFENKIFIRITQSITEEKEAPTNHGGKHSHKKSKKTKKHRKH